MNRCGACSRPLVKAAGGRELCANANCAGTGFAHRNRVNTAERPGAARLLKALVAEGLAPGALEAGARLALALDTNTTTKKGTR